MKTRIVLLAIAVPAILAGCQSGGGRETIAQLRSVKLDIKEERIEGGLEKAMEGYQRFLDETPESALTPEAMRRLADLKIEREYGHLTGGAAALPAPERTKIAGLGKRESAQAPQGESQADFEKRALQSPELPASAEAGQVVELSAEELERKGAREAIRLYRQLLARYPGYQGNDRVLYQMSRAYEELGDTERAMEVMDWMVRDFPTSRFLDEVQFRRAEFFFVHRRYLDAEKTYKVIVDKGTESRYYELALYKLGWTFYKQEFYEEGLARFIALLDHKVATGYDFAQTEDEQEKKRVDDTFRVVSQSFSYLQGAQSVMEFFDANGKRSYEDRVYSNLGEFYFEKRRFADAAAAYNAFIKRNPFHRVSPQFDMRVIEIQMAGNFPSLVIDAKKQFARNYGLKGDYWKHFDPATRPEVLGFLKTNFTDLAQHYHSLYQNPQLAKEKTANFGEAMHWYGEFLLSFPQDPESPAINFQLAELLLENRSFAQAALEYEKTAYTYPKHEKSSAAGYSAIYAYREHLRAASPEEKDGIKRETVRSSLKFVETYPEHEKAAIVLGAAADDQYDMKDYEPALATAKKLIETFPNAERDVLKSAWVVTGHACYELQRYPDAEAAYVQVLALLPAEDANRAVFTDNLAASVYKQGELASAAKDYKAAADHFLRVGRVAAGSKIRVNAEYDAATALVELKEWKQAATVLSGFRELFPGHELQPEVTRKIAQVYREDGQIAAAAAEYERVETEFKDEEVRRGALILAAELHEKAGNPKKALSVYRRFVGYFPVPIEISLEMRNKITEILKAQNEQERYLAELEQIVLIEAAAGDARTARTRYIAGKAALVLAEQTYERFAGVKLVQPFETNLLKKKTLMKASTAAFNALVGYEVGEVTAAATYYLAEIYGDFSKSLTGSERPTNLNAVELQEYELAIEEQAFPFEEKAIQIHEKNLELIGGGIYNGWIDKSMGKLAKLVPARYDKPEVQTELVASLEGFSFEIERPAPPAEPAPPAATPAAAAETAPAVVEEKPAASQAQQVEEAAASAEPAVKKAAPAKAGVKKGTKTKGKAPVKQAAEKRPKAGAKATARTKTPPKQAAAAGQRPDPA